MSGSVLIQDAPATVLLRAMRPKKRRIYYPERDGKQMAETDAHRDQMVELIEGLRLHFVRDPNIYVTGNIMFYYLKGNPQKCLSPDVMVVKGVSKKKRRTFRLWDERPPRVVFEVSSNSTKQEDFGTKLERYAGFGVPEYYIFDPEQEDAGKAFTPFRLVGGVYQRVAVAGGRIYSPELGLEIAQVGQTLRLYDPAKEQWIPTREEAEAARAEEAAARRRAEAGLRQADERIARLQAELERLRGKPAKDDDEV